MKKTKYKISSHEGSNVTSYFNRVDKLWVCRVLLILGGLFLGFSTWGKLGDRVVFFKNLFFSFKIVVYLPQLLTSFY